MLYICAKFDENISKCFGVKNPTQKNLNGNADTMVTADCFLVLCTGKLKTDFTEHLNSLSKIEIFYNL